MGKPTGLAKEQRRTLDRLKAVRGIDRFYLAGGSAVAIHLNHRRSLDLDLFSSSADVDLSAIARTAMVVLPNVKILGLTDASLRMVTDAVPVDLVRYPYPPLEPPSSGPEGFPVAGVRDLAAMKLTAIARRGLRRDFWDLHAILQSGLSLRDAGVDRALPESGRYIVTARCACEWPRAWARERSRGTPRGACGARRRATPAGSAPGRTP